MRIYRFKHDGVERIGIADGETIRISSAKDLFSSSPDTWKTAGETSLSAIKPLAPVHPGKIIGIGRNYAGHAKELGNEAPPEPLIFLKAKSTLTDPEAEIVMPPESERVDYEGELAVVIGRRARRVRAEDWRSVVFGFTCGNDVTARDLQMKDVQFTRGKSFDTFCPLGPAIVTNLDVTDIAVMTRVNGETRQNARTSLMIFPVPRLVEFVTSIMTLEPGDVILTGTPAGVGPLAAGDVVEVEIEGIGILRNRAGVERV
ncbi:MAG: fumarylacetoacetate hydrolase family protein [Thermoanaerobaculia bacterium]